jgi:cytosine/uracil/thiamine/allantoin permease
MLLLPHSSPNPGTDFDRLQAVAILYMSIQTLYASYFVNVMLRCVFGHKWTDVPNRELSKLPSSATES